MRRRPSSEARPLLVAFGANLADPRRALPAAREALAAAAGLCLQATSGLYRTTPVGGPPQPDYLNAVARFACRLAADRALALLHDVEDRFGRLRTGPDHPRTLDLDLLLLGDVVHRSPRLVVPHPRMLDRGFVMIPAAEAAGGLRHPVTGATLGEHAARLDGRGVVSVAPAGSVVMTPTLHETIAGLRAALAPDRARGATIGLVPTMGALHDGHASLVERAVDATDVVVASIFVNPTQFGPGEDLDRYPRTLDADRALLADRGCHHVFVPAAAEMYPEGFATSVGMTGLTEVLCGASRPGHFGGVLTVVLKLLNIVGPDVAFFGRKDLQQCLVIRRMARDLDLRTRIEACPIVREEDGLALSSRNRYLSDDERRDALALREAVLAINRAFVDGERSAAALTAIGNGTLGEHPLVRKDYLEIRDPNTLARRDETAREGDVVAVAAFLGETRLIDNGLLGWE